MPQREPWMTLADCPVKATADVLAGKWKPLILYFLKAGPLRFGRLQRCLGAVSQKVLTEQLRELEHDRVVLRSVLPGKMAQVEYRLSPEGLALVPVLALMAEWGLAHRQHGTGDAAAGTVAD